MSRFGSLVALALLFALPVHATGAPSPQALDAAPLHVLPAERVERVRTALPAQDRNGPLRLAIPTPLSLGLPDGAWSEEGELSLWRLRVRSDGATLLSAAFDRLSLPDEAELRFSDVTGSVVQGPYTSRDPLAEGRLWTAMVPGEEALIELRVPTARRDSVDLHLATLGHGVYPVRAEGVQAKSGGCNVDAQCEVDTAWRDQQRSVVLLQIAGTGCTGTLVNTRAQDGRPYILTAHHCGVTTSNADGVIAYFNYRTSTCGGTPDGSLAQNLRGSQRLFSHAGSDHTLIRLTSAIPATFGAYFAGFDAEAGAVPQNGRGIHHPNADEMRISTYTTPARKEQITLTGGGTIDAFEVTWSAGVTEPGSSGSSLWNQNRQIVGVLSGGDSTCGQPPSLTNPLGTPFSNGPDYYGRLHVAWSAGLRTWLDPNGSGGTSVGGRNASEVSPPADDDDGTASRSGGGGGGGSFGVVATVLMLLAGALRRAGPRITSRRASRGAGAG